MSEEVIISNLKDILTEYIEIEEFNPQMSLKGDIGLDSFGLISMICQIEQQFNISIPDYELEKFMQLKDLISYIQLNAIA